ncbi:MAG: peptidoglycan-binding domain-containing protein [Candidatus Nomurabacteria bacterium]
MVSIFILSPQKSAKAEIVLCVNSSIKDYLMIDSQYTCPSGYVVQKSAFDPTGYSFNTTYDPTLANDTNITATSTNSKAANSGSGNGTVISPTDSTGNSVDPLSSVQDIPVKQETIINPDPILASGPFLTLDPTDYPYCVSLGHDLFYGSKDSNTKGDISALQSYLTDRGFLETGATGFFGRATEWGVKRFQYINQITVSGVVSSDMRDVLKELTCVKYPKVTYVDKPLSPSQIQYTKLLTKAPKTSQGAKKPVIKKVTIIPTTKSTTAVEVPVINNYVSVTPAPNTTNQIQSNNGPILNNSKLSSLGGTISFAKSNRLYFTFNTNSSNASICINIGNADCSVSSNYKTLTNGVNGSLYEATNLSGQWAFTIYGNQTWGSTGNKINLFLKDNPNSNVISVYTVILSN